MRTPELVILFFCFSLGLWNLWVTIRLWRSELLFNVFQKAAQTVIIWMIPIAGAGVVSWLLSRGDMNEKGRMSSPESQAAQGQDLKYTGGFRP